MNFLNVKNLSVSYGAIQALHGISFEIQEGEFVSLLGANGAGKSTTLRTISRLLAIKDGRILFCGEDLSKVPAHTVVAKGIAHVPEGRGIFPNLTVQENLHLATWTNKNKSRLVLLQDLVFNLFPKLNERQKQVAGTLSGGEQQMLAVGRALMTDCKLLLLDEPSMGLSPLLAKDVFLALKEINKQGKTILVVEQNAHLALKFASRGYVLENGRIVLAGLAGQLLQDERVKEAYLGKKGKNL